ncbi:MAG: hypothetical protein AWT59_0420 [Candidatus Gallionella acididurans]|uniref:Uncharacterized protein n=1 Tax=Candidatus Gallionella acididurans TaxID=1796491 RepID=A0A139BWL1_9PROT|nr:MAG: hypothetical protein AWT59_0420 [Candidatus Gallionella acididurans]
MMASFRNRLGRSLRLALRDYRMFVGNAPLFPSHKLATLVQCCFGALKNELPDKTSTVRKANARIPFK